MIQVKTSSHVYALGNLFPVEHFLDNAMMSAVATLCHANYFCTTTYWIQICSTSRCRIFPKAATGTDTSANGRVTVETDVKGGGDLFTFNETVSFFISINDKPQEAQKVLLQPIEWARTL